MMMLMMMIMMMMMMMMMMMKILQEPIGPFHAFQAGHSHTPFACYMKMKHCEV